MSLEQGEVSHRHLFDDTSVILGSTELASGVVGFNGLHIHTTASMTAIYTLSSIQFHGSWYYVTHHITHYMFNPCPRLLRSLITFHYITKSLPKNIDNLE